MTEAEARRILGKAIQGNGSLYNGFDYVSWEPDDETTILDGQFTAERLEAIAWWMRNKRRNDAKRGA